MKTIINLILLAVIAAGITYGYFMYEEFSAPKAPEGVNNYQINNDQRENADADENITAYDTIVVTSPRPHEILESPIILEGEAQGAWYFEGSFPVTLLDMEGNLIAAGFVQSQGEWMTEDFVAFEGSLAYAADVETKAILVMREDDPSGEGMNDQFIEIPVVLSPAEPVEEVFESDVMEEAEVIDEIDTNKAIESDTNVEEENGEATDVMGATNESVSEENIGGNEEVVN